MRIADHLSEKEKQQLKKVKSPEKVNWKEIMGMDRDTYKRVRGAVRRK
jgi:hypothetical protein